MLCPFILVLQQRLRLIPDKNGACKDGSSFVPSCPVAESSHRYVSTTSFAVQVKVVIDAYILGTLFHYIVKKDPEVEATKELMQELRAYCAERQLPSELAAKMVCPAAPTFFCSCSGDLALGFLARLSAYVSNVFATGCPLADSCTCSQEAYIVFQQKHSSAVANHVRNVCTPQLLSVLL